MTTETAPLLTVTVATPPPSKPMPSENTLLRHGGGWKKHGWVKRCEGDVLAAKATLHPYARRVFPLLVARLRLTVYYTGVPQDQTNMVGGALKIMEDALVNCNILAGDTPAHLPCTEVLAVRVAHRVERRVTAELWPLEGTP